MQTECEGHPRARADRMRHLELRELLLIPGVVAVTTDPPQLDAERRIDVDELELDAVLRQRADGGEPVFCRRRLHRVEQRAEKFRRHGADEVVAMLAPEPLEHSAANLLRARSKPPLELRRCVVARDRRVDAAGPAPCRPDWLTPVRERGLIGAVEFRRAREAREADPRIAGAAEIVMRPAKRCRWRRPPRRTCRPACRPRRTR